MLCTGCALQRTVAWQEGGANVPTESSRKLRGKAQQIFDVADSEEKLRQAIQGFEAVVQENPGDYTALKSLSSQYILLGTAYTEKTSEKTEYFMTAIRYAELAMYTNPEFQKAITEGLEPWQAVDTLTANETEAMFFWVTAVQYEFKEGMNLAEKIINVKWLQRTLPFLDRIEKVAPEFGGGSVQFAKMISYYALPESRGGSKELGDKYMQLSIERSSNWLLPRWGRGKYYYDIRDDDLNSRKDLEWVASQNPDEFDDPYPWRVHFLDDAKRILAD